MRLNIVQVPKSHEPGQLECFYSPIDLEIGMISAAYWNLDFDLDLVHVTLRSFSRKATLCIPGYYPNHGL